MNLFESLREEHEIFRKPGKTQTKKKLTSLATEYRKLMSEEKVN